jgi:TamB, inner membrane protein subunit of TAM complex
MPRNPLRLTEGLTAHRFSAPRFYAIVVVFVALSAWAINTSERFQNLFHGVSQARLSEVLHRPVSFRTVDFRIFPPSVRLQDVVIGNDPRAGATPLFAAEEVSIGGGVSLVGQELRLGRIRAVKPRIDLEQFADGSWNLPHLTGASAEGGIQLHLNDILVQEGVVDFQGRQIAIDGSLEDFTAELAARGSDRLTGRLLARRGTLGIANAEPLVFSLTTRVSIDTRRGITFDDFLVKGEFGELRGTGAVERFTKPRVSFDVRGRVAVQEVERIFRSTLGFAGRADVHARIEVPPDGRFRITGAVTAAAVDAHGFPIQDVAATVVAEPQELVATIDRAFYQGGRTKGSLRIGNLVAKPQSFTLALEADGVSVERFFGDLDLEGTGFSGAMSLTAALRWGEEGIERANGGGSVSIRAGSAVSLVKGRFGVPMGGGGPLSIVSGRIGLEAATFRFPQSTVDATGGIQIGKWQPDFDLKIRSRDLSEMDRIFQNLTAASGGTPEPLGAGGNGEAWGHLAGRWADPIATLQVTAEAARWGGVAFGSVRGTVGIEKGAFLFRPLRVYDADASFALEGSVRYRPEPGLPKFDIVASAHDYPLKRILEYLDFQYPIDGLVTGTFPISGTADALTGGGAVSLKSASVWGQKVASLTGKVLFTPGRMALEDVRGSVGSGAVGGSGWIGMADKTFEVKAAGDGIRLEEIDVAALDPKQAGGKLSFQLTGRGTLERPSLSLSATLAEARIFGHSVPDPDEPRLDAEVREGVLDGSVAAPGRWTLTAKGDLFAEAPAIEFALDAPDLHSLIALTPLDLPPAIRGTLATSGRVSFGNGKGAAATARLTVSRLRLDLPDRPSVLALASPAAVTFEGGKLSVAPSDLTSEHASLRFSGSYDTAGKGSVDLAVKGELDARALDLLFADFGLSGRLTVDITARGPVSSPALTGALRLEDGRYRPPGLSQIADQMTGVVRLDGSRADIEGVRAKIGGGDLYVSGSVALQGLSPGDVRLTIQGRRVSFRYPQDLRLTADADLTVLTGSTGNQVRGEIVLLSGVYSKDFEITLASLLERRPAALGAHEPWKDRTALDVRIVSSSGLEVQNNVARLNASVDLVARGTLAEPSLVGQITLVEGGRITFRGVRYEVEAGTVLFAGGKEFAPIVDVRARAPLSGYDIVVSVAGTWPRLQTSFTSDPPLADDVVLSMLLSGSTAGSVTAPGSVANPSTAGTTLAGAAGGIVADVLTSPISKGTQKLFKLDRFEIEPVFSGNQVDVRSTVGKQITPNLLVTYSQSIDTAKQPIINVEWRLTDTITARALRDENGILVIDIRRRLRL